MVLKNLPNYTFTWKGFLALFLGGLLPLIFLEILGLVFRFAFNIVFSGTYFYMLVSNVLMWLGAILAFDYFVCRPATHQKLRFRFSSKDLSTYLIIFPMIFGMMLIAEFMVSLVPTTGYFFGYMYDKFSEIMEMVSGNLLFTILTAVIMAPIFEEIVFRGIIQKGLINKGMNPNKAIWISAISFGIIHGNPWQLIGAILLGYVLGVVYHKTKSLLLPILLHFFNNLVATISLEYGHSESFSELLNVSEYIILAVGIILFSTFYILFLRKYKTIN